MNEIIRLLGPAILLAAPIMYAALGGMFTQRAGIFNIALEGFMLLAAYASVAAASSSGSLLIGTIVGVLAATVTAAVMAVLVVGFRADEVIVGIAVNVFAVGLTTFLYANAQTSSQSLELTSGYPQLHLTWLAHVPVLREIFTDRDLLIWLLIPAVAAVAYVFRRTSFGLRLKATGEAPLAARAAGVRVAGVRFVSILVSGAFAGLGGAELAIGSVHLFSENMTAGRGIIAFAAVIFGAGLVNRTVAACLLFGFAQALAGLLQIRTSFPSQFVLMMPFLLTMAAIVLSDIVRRRRGRTPSSTATTRPGLRAGAGVVVAGHLTIDDVRLPGGRNYRATTGGAAAYTALGMFLAGGKAVIVARVGPDYPLRRLQLRHADGGRVDLSNVTTCNGRSIHNVARYTDDGSRVIDIENFDVLVEQTPRPEDLAALELHNRWVLVAPASLPQQQQLIATLHTAGAHIALDTELHYLQEDDALARLTALTRQVDCFLPSVEHLRHLLDADPAGEAQDLTEAVHHFGCPLTVVKRGSRGVTVYDAQSPLGISVAAVPNIQVVDPTGAGDGFNGGFLADLCRDIPPQEAAVTGCVAASFVIEAAGVKVPAGFNRDERLARQYAVTRASASPSERESLA